MQGLLNFVSCNSSIATTVCTYAFRWQEEAECSIYLDPDAQVCEANTMGEEGNLLHAYAVMLRPLYIVMLLPLNNCLRHGFHAILHFCVHFTCP